MSSDSEKPKASSAGRVKRHTQKLVESGGRRITIKLGPDANQAMDRITDKTGESPTELINRLLITCL